VRRLEAAGWPLSSSAFSQRLETEPCREREHSCRRRPSGTPAGAGAMPHPGTRTLRARPVLPSWPRAFASYARPAHDGGGRRERARTCV
jgi:hypothetical protein